MCSTRSKAGCFDHVAAMGDLVERGLRAMVARLGLDADVRGKGLIWGVDLGRDAAAVIPAALDRGLVVNRTSETVVRLLPPYVITEAEIATRPRAARRCALGQCRRNRMLASPLPLTSAPAPASLAGLTLARPVSVATGIAAIRRADLGDVEAILALIAANLSAGHLLPRTREDVTRRIGRFLVVDIEGQVAGCAELAPLSRAVAEVRSLVVDEGCRGRGFGTRLVEELKRWAIQDGFSTVCAFTHHASHFVRLGFSIVPHQWLPEKIATDCAGCPKFRQCAQFAMALPLRGRSLRTTPAGQRPYLALPRSSRPFCRSRRRWSARSCRCSGRGLTLEF